jgi:error-prone DNA polymerase
MLGAIDACFALIARQTSTRPALHGVSCDDLRVYDAICRGDTIGVFQIESRAQISFCLPQLQPRTYEDLTVAVALVRPGPIQANATHPYLHRRQGLEPVTYPGGAVGRHLVEPVLADTLGVCVFQDQVVELCRAAGLGAAEAAEVRRAMSSARSPERMAALRGRLDEALAAHGLDAAGRAEILDVVQAFAGYGFVRGHAAAFAYLAYLSAWIKVYHPAALCAALLNMQPMGFYSPEVVAQDARRHGVRILPPNLLHSQADCVLEDGAVRLGLRLVRGLGADACARLEAAVAQEPFPRDLEELCVRARLDEDEALALARSGALSCYFAERRQALWQAPLVARAARERWLPALRAAIDPPVCLPTPTPAETFALDRAALGLAPEGHVLMHLRPALGRRRLHRAAELATVPASSVVEAVGQAVVLQSPPTAKGVWFMTLSDETGMINVVVPPAIYVRDRAAVRGEALVWIRGSVERRGGVVAIHAAWVRPLSHLLR